jgi:hypothetical protein
MYKELEPFMEYIHSIRKLENYLSFDMIFPSRWSLPKTLVEENQLVGFETKDSNYKGISFVSLIDEKEVTITLVKIAKVIKLNKEKEMKENLFKETIEKLRQTFEKTSLDKLKNIYFDFPEEETNLNIDEIDKSEREDVKLVGE